MKLRPSPHHLIEGDVSPELCTSFKGVHRCSLPPSTHWRPKLILAKASVALTVLWEGEGTPRFGEGGVEEERHRQRKEKFSSVIY